jgi:hypothetical protein
MADFLIFLGALTGYSLQVLVACWLLRALRCYPWRKGIKLYKNAYLRHKIYFI